MRILIVDDDKDTVNALSKLISLKGHEVTAATTLADARQQCRTGALDLIISDIVLPDGDGRELARLAERCSIRVVALTGTPKSDLETGDAAHFYACLTKPVRWEELQRVIDLTDPSPHLH